MRTLARALGLATTLVLAAPPAPAAPAPLAFPGAVGYGAATTGGRGGEVHVVDSLADSGPGTLRACLLATGPRHCVVTVSGTIETDTPIFVKAANGRVSVWGQASPGGVQVTQKAGARDGRTSLIFQDVDHVVIRNIRIRPRYDRARQSGIRGSIDCLTFERGNHHVVDHVSCEWAADEGINDFQGGRFVTYSNNLVAETLAGHPYGAVSCSDAHKATRGCGSFTWHANAFHKNGRRSPNMKTAGGQDGPHDLINNLISAPGEVGAEIHDDHPGPDGTGTWANVVGNVAQRGPKTTTRTALINEGNWTNAINVWFARDNVATGMRLYGVNNPWNYTLPGPTRTSPVAPLSVTPWPASETKARVLARVGAWPRDAVDQRQVAEMGGPTSTGTTPAAGGPWPVLGGPAAPADTDRDGMSDAWERVNGLAVGLRDHNADPDGDGYTAVEEYMAELMDELLPAGAP